MTKDFIAGHIFLNKHQEKIGAIIGFLLSVFFILTSEEAFGIGSFFALILPWTLILPFGVAIVGYILGKQQKLHYVIDFALILLLSILLSIIKIYFGLIFISGIFVIYPGYFLGRKKKLYAIIYFFVCFLLLALSLILFLPAQFFNSHP